jgi:hypothetical protein
MVRAMGVPARPDVESSGQSGVIITGWFEKVRLRPLRRFGTYRREGSIGVSSDGLTISGRHVLPAPIRLAIGIPLCALTLVVGYGVVEYLLLKAETLFVPWSSVDGFVVDGQQSRVAFTFQGTKETSPVVFSTGQAQWLYATMQQYVPASDLGQGVVKARPLLILAAIATGTAAITLILAMFGLLK